MKLLPILSLFLLAISANQVNALPGQAKVVNDDRDVIQTAMLSFFNHEEWHSADWKPKKQVILHPQFRTKDRPNFSEQLQKALDRSQQEVTALSGLLRKKDATPDDLKRYRDGLKWSSENLANLKALQARKWSANYKAANLIPLKDMEWDKRIVVTNESGRRWSRNKDKPSTVEEWTVEGYPARPSYSPDGSVAIVEFGIPWSMHSSDVTFVFERTDSGWKRLAVVSVFYV